jgi:hypothetical protein
MDLVFGQKTMNNFGVSFSIFIAIFKVKLYKYFVGFCFIRIENYFSYFIV